MPVFHLFPKPEGLADPNWQATVLKVRCWVEADDEAQARQRIAYATAIAVEHEPGRPVRTSPWKNGELTECVEDVQPPGQIGYGVIYTEEGRTITIK